MATEDNKNRMKGSENPFFMEEKPKRTKIWVVLVIIILLAAAAVAVFLNLFGIKDLLISTIIMNEPSYAQAYSKLEDRQKEIDRQKEVLDQMREELEIKEATLDRRQNQLEERQNEMDAAAAATESGTGGGAVLTEQEEENYTLLAKIYENMDPKNAAETFEAMNDNAEVAKIMKFMKAKSSGAVLEQLSAQMAAEISKLMTK